MSSQVHIVEASVVEPPIPARRVAWALLIITLRVVTWPVRWIAGHITAIALRLYVHYRVQANSRAKCPACGIRAEHDMRWSEAYSALVHVCKRCMAVWTEKPMVDAAQWRTTLVAAEEEAVAADGTRTTTVQHAQREPQVINEYKPTGNDKPVVVRMMKAGKQ